MIAKSPARRIVKSPARKIPPLLTAWLAIAVLACLWSLGAHMRIGLNTDHLIAMFHSSKLIQGGVPYVDFVEVNPPMINLLFLLPLYLSILTRIPADVTLYLLTYALIAGGLLLVHGMLRRSNVPLPVRLSALSAIALALLFASFIHQPFADREHLMMCFIAPWLVLYSPLVNYDSVPRWQRILVAVLAGVGLAIKPYFYIFYAFSFAYTVLYLQPLQTTLRQREHHIVWGIGAVYVVIVFLFFREYLLTVVPVALQTYGVLGWAWQYKVAVIVHDFFGYALPGVLGTAILWWLNPRLIDRTLLYLFVLLLAGLTSYIINAGWYYTQYPFIAAGMILLIAVGARLLTAAMHDTEKRRRLVSLGIVSVLLAGGGYMYYLAPILYRANLDMAVQRAAGHPLANIEMYPPAYEKIESILDRHPRFMLLSTGLSGFSLMKKGTPRYHAGRFEYLWSLPGTVHIGKDPLQKAVYEDLVAYLSGSIADNLARQKPDLVINDISPSQRALPVSHNVLPLLKGDKRFQKEWENYSFSETINTCKDKVVANCAFEIYLKKAQ